MRNVSLKTRPRAVTVEESIDSSLRRASDG